MNGESIVVALVIAVAVLVLLIAKLASFLKAFTEDTRYICREMDDADSYEEYRLWRGELRCHYLMLIPFVNEKNVMRLYDRIFHRADRAKKEERKDSIAPLLMPSILGICICLVCVCGMTWAWYTASVQTPTQKMTAAYYEGTVEAVMGCENEINKTNDGYTLTAGTTYTVILKANGSVKDCGGYCLIENTSDGTKSYTQTIMPGDDIKVSFKPKTNGTYTFTGVWGSHPVGINEDDIIRENTKDTTDTSTTDLNTPPVTDDTTPPAPTDPTTEQTELSGTYTVQAGDTLSGIAAKYNTTAAKLAAYNNISDPSLIKSGQVLNIPPQDYVIPETTAPSEPTPSEPIPPETVPPASEPVTEPQTEPVTDAPTIAEPITEPSSTTADTAEPTETVST